MFLLFRYDAYYPEGGEGDFAGRFDSLETAAMAHRAARFSREFAEVYDVSADEWHDVSSWHPSDDFKER